MLRVMTDATFLVASAQDGGYPRPQLLRSHWADLSGVWDFEYDDADIGVASDWHRGDRAFTRTINVPFPPESPDSGIGDTSPHRVVWYRRSLTAKDLSDAGHIDTNTLVLHFGAVDYRAQVWADGHLIASHEGGSTPFSAVVPAPTDGTVIVVRAEDNPDDVGQPRGKQDWQAEPHVIWYDRTTGIWQPVWLESVAPQHLARITWKPDTRAANVGLDIELSTGSVLPATVSVRLLLGDEHLAQITTTMRTQRQSVSIPVDALRNGQDHERFDWSPDRPTLIDAELTVADAQGHVTDRASSYFGFRTVGTHGGAFLLNGFPHPVRGVLEQGFWPTSHLAAPSAQALREEVELIKDIGFNTVRIHQKIEDPRFLFWADKLGLMVWAELPSAYEFSDVATQRLTNEWLEVLRRDASHPSIVTWVPFNESWGLPDLPRNAAQRSLTQALYHLTKAFDSTRVVISNDGWEHTESDLCTVHDYENDPQVFAATYATAESIREAFTGVSPNGRRMGVSDQHREELFTKPIMVTEFGGVSYDPESSTDSWGYRVVDSTEALERQLAALFQGVHASSTIAGWCYTQISDTQQETNGLVDQYRKPKLPLQTLRRIITGS